MRQRHGCSQGQQVPSQREHTKPCSPPPSGISMHKKYQYPELAPYTPISSALEQIRPERFPSIRASSLAVVSWTDRAAKVPHQQRNAAYCERHGYTCWFDTTRRLPHLGELPGFKPSWRIQGCVGNSSVESFRPTDPPALPGRAIVSALTCVWILRCERTIL